MRSHAWIVTVCVLEKQENIMEHINNGDRKNSTVVRPNLG